MFSRYAAEGGQLRLVGVEGPVERLPGDPAEADVRRLGEAAADPLLDTHPLALSGECDDDRLLARALQPVSEGDRRQQLVREVAGTCPPDRVVVEEARARRRVAREPRLDEGRIVERLGAATERDVHHHPTPRGNVDARVRPVLLRQAVLQLLTHGEQGRRRLRSFELDVLLPEDELGLGGRLDFGKDARREVEFAGLLQGAEHVPRQGALAVLGPEPCSLGAPPPAGDRLGDQLPPGDDVVERALEHVGRRRTEARGRAATRQAALAVVVVAPGELGVVVPGQRTGDPASWPPVDEARIVLDEAFDDLRIEVAPAVGAGCVARRCGHATLTLPAAGGRGLRGHSLGAAPEEFPLPAPAGPGDAPERA